MALSAPIRQYMATGPRAGFHRLSGSTTTADDALMDSPLLVMPVGIFGMLQIPQWTAAFYFWNDCKVIRRRGRGRGPLESPGIPRIASGDPATKVGPEKVSDKNQEAGRLKEHPNGHDQVPYVPAAAGFVGINPPRHSENSWNVHEVERQVKTDHKEPEVQFAESLAVHSS